jgi:hypothetical protein
MGKVHTAVGEAATVGEGVYYSWGGLHTAVGEAATFWGRCILQLGRAALYSTAVGEAATVGEGAYYSWGGCTSILQLKKSA